MTNKKPVQYLLSVSFLWRLRIKYFSIGFLTALILAFAVSSARSSSVCRTEGEYQYCTVLIDLDGDGQPETCTVKRHARTGEFVSESCAHS